MLQRAGDYIESLVTGVGDRQPAEHVQDPEVEQRRVKDVRVSLETMRNVMVAVIEDLEKYGFLTEEFEEEFGGSKDTDPDDPCAHPSTFIEWMRCYGPEIIELIRWCKETRIYWTNMLPSMHSMNYEITKSRHELVQWLNAGMPGKTCCPLPDAPDVDSDMNPGPGDYLCYDAPNNEWTSAPVEGTDGPKMFIQSFLPVSIETGDFWLRQ